MGDQIANLLRFLCAIIEFRFIELHFLSLHLSFFPVETRQSFPTLLFMELFYVKGETRFSPKGVSVRTGTVLLPVPLLVPVGILLVLEQAGTWVTGRLGRRE